jgi:hypothetical protein
MLSVSSFTFHSVVFPLWLIKALFCCCRCVPYAVFCYSIVIVVPIHVDKNPSEDGHSLPKHAKDN